MKKEIVLTDRAYFGTILAIIVTVFTLCYACYAQSNAPAPAPAQVAPAPQQPPILVPPAVALAVKRAIDDLPLTAQGGGTWTGLSKAIGGKYPLTAMIAAIIGLLKILVLPFHTALDQFNLRKLTPDKYKAIKAEGSTLFKQLDWLCYAVFSIRPSTIMAASSANKASHIFRDSPTSEEWARANGWTPPIKPAP